jgi:Tol biopolymer transport system component
VGAGGMGDVYRARDTRLDRIVALKVSKEEFTPRFETEARATAALEHPHICRLYDVCHENGASFLVMEFVEGTPLNGPLPLDQALVYAAQIIGALDEAHRKQIVHRDLKPSNILVTAKGGVKLLDFGLAKLGRGDAPLDDAALTRGITAAGTILGTLHYMSPEQLQGAPADARSDIFAFGLVLYEMLTGKRAFDGASAASIIAAILERPAPSVAEVAPSSLDRLLKRCLAKDPDDRWQSARDVKAALELIAEPSISVQAAPVPAVRKAPVLPWLVAGTLLAGLAGLAFIHFREVSLRAGIVTFQIPAPENTTIVSAPYLSPDGTSVAFVATRTGGVPAIWLRSVDTLEARMLAGTENASQVFWSPDSRFIAFSADGTLKKIEVSGGAVRPVSDVAGTGGGSWNAEDVIIFSGLRFGLFRVSASGGDPVQLTTPTENEAGHFAPTFLPDGRRFLYVAATRDRKVEVRLASLDGSATSRFPLGDGSRIAYVPPEAGAREGHLLFVRGDALIAQPLDDATFTPIGEPRQVADNIGGVDSQAQGAFSVSSTGALAFLAGDTLSVSQLTWFDREGNALGTIGPPAGYNDLSLSPDETRLAVTKREGRNQDIWLVDLARNAWTRFTSDEAQDWHPVWSPEGSQLVFSSTRLLGTRTNSLFWKVTSNIKNEELFHRAPSNLRVNDWSPDGEYLLISRTENRGDLLVLPVAPDTPGGERKALPYLQSPQFAEVRGQFFPVKNPGGRNWVVYTSDESSQLEIYVESFPRGAPQIAVSSGLGGMQPRWRRDGKELFYISLDRKLMAVDVIVGSELRFGVPRELFQTRLSASDTNTPPVLRYDVTRDGKRFLINSEPESSEATSAPITVVLNWTTTLNK